MTELLNATHKLLGNVCHLEQAARTEDLEAAVVELVAIFNFAHHWHDKLRELQQAFTLSQATTRKLQSLVKEFGLCNVERHLLAADPIPF